MYICILFEDLVDCFKDVAQVCTSCMTCDFDGKLDLGEFLKTNPRVLELILQTPLIPGGSSIVHGIRMKFGESETNKISTSKIISELQSLVSPPSAMDVFITKKAQRFE